MSWIARRSGRAGEELEGDHAGDGQCGKELMVMVCELRETGWTGAARKFQG